MQKLIKYKPLDILRYSQGDYNDLGYWVEGTESTVSITANLQPVKYHEVLQMPDADRTSKWCKIFTYDLIRTKKEGDGGWGADRFEWQGDTYEIRQVKQWDAGHIDHFVGMAVRLSLAPDGEA